MARPVNDGKHLERLQAWLDANGANWGQHEADIDYALRDIERQREAIEHQINNIENWIETGKAAGPLESCSTYVQLCEAIGREPKHA